MRKIIPIIFFLIVSFFTLKVGLASVEADTDRDGVADKDEIGVYMTDPNKADTDGDGYSDWRELNTGYSPHNPKAVKLEKNDQDNDGLSDRLELNFHTNLLNPDSDGDGRKDGEEINNGFDPLSKEAKLLPKRLEINTGKQELSYFLGGVRLGTYMVSTGRPGMATPKGHFKIQNKYPRPWSKAYGLWMPYWLGIDSGKFGIHELPEWPGGIKEGENHLGKPVSHGCIRLGVGPAKFIYDWTPVGTPIFIY